MTKSVPSDMLRISKKRRRQLERQRKKRRHRIIVCIAIVITLCAVALSFRVIPYIYELTAFQREQAYATEMRDINPDYVGQLKIDGTAIDYPVVRGNDNEKYLNTAFNGEEHRLGAIFMDYRCVGDYVPHIIIYGHEVEDDLMFGGLQKFFDERYLSEHPTITFTENGKVSEFEIFSARISDIYDPAYYLDFNATGSFRSFAERNGATADAEQIITLSTCVGANNDKRMIVQGVLKHIDS
jgi:sortase B